MADLNAAIRCAGPSWWERLWRSRQDPPSAGEVEERAEPPGYAEPAPGLPPDLVGPHGTVTHSWYDATASIRGYRTVGGAYPITRGRGRRRRPDSTGPGIWPMISSGDAPWVPDGTKVRVLGQGKARGPERGEPRDLARRDDLVDIVIVELLESPGLPADLVGTQWGMRPEDVWESQTFDTRRRPASKQAMPMPSSLSPGLSMQVKELAEHESYRKKHEVRFTIENERRKTIAYVAAIEVRPRTWQVVQSWTDVDGLGAYLYDRLLSWVSDRGGTLASDSDWLVSEEAKNVWKKFYERDDVERIPTQRPAPFRDSYDVHDDPALMHRYRKRSMERTGAGELVDRRIDELAGTDVALRQQLEDAARSLYQDGYEDEEVAAQLQLRRRRKVLERAPNIDGARLAGENSRYWIYALTAHKGAVALDPKRNWCITRDKATWDQYKHYGCHFWVHVSKDTGLAEWVVGQKTDFGPDGERISAIETYSADDEIQLSMIPDVQEWHVNEYGARDLGVDFLQNVLTRAAAGDPEMVDRLVDGGLNSVEAIARLVTQKALDAQMIDVLYEGFEAASEGDDPDTVRRRMLWFGGLRDAIASIGRQAAILVEGRAYHGTPDEFVELDHDKSGLGTHFGTVRAASERLESVTFSPTRKKTQKPATIKVYELHVKNPLVLTDKGGRAVDLGLWRWWDIADALAELGVLTQSQLDDMYTLMGPPPWYIPLGVPQVERLETRDGNVVRRYAFQYLRDQIEAAGYDSVAYENKFEDVGSTSYIVWRPDLIELVGDRGWDLAWHETRAHPTKSEGKFTESQLPHRSSHAVARRVANDPAVATVRWNGIPVDIEWAAGSVRKYEDSDYARYVVPPYSYGYIRGTAGEDGEELDCFVNPDSQDVDNVYIVAQRAGAYEAEGGAALGSFDEFDLVLGASDESEAEAVMRLHYNKEQVGSVFAVPVAEFRSLVLPILGAPERQAALIEPVSMDVLMPLATEAATALRAGDTRKADEFLVAMVAPYLDAFPGLDAWFQPLRASADAPPILGGQVLYGNGLPKFDIPPGPTGVVVTLNSTALKWVPIWQLAGQLARTMQHELIHLEQFARGKGKIRQDEAKNFSWKQERYLERPIEIEAYAQAIARDLHGVGLDPRRKEDLLKAPEYPRFVEAYGETPHVMNRLHRLIAEYYDWYSRQAALIGVEGQEGGIPVTQVVPGDRVRLLAPAGGLRADALASVFGVDPAGPVLHVRARGMDQDPADGSWGTDLVEASVPLEDVVLVLAPGDPRVS